MMSKTYNKKLIAKEIIIFGIFLIAIISALSTIWLINNYKQKLKYELKANQRKLQYQKIKFENPDILDDFLVELKMDYSLENSANDNQKYSIIDLQREEMYKKYQIDMILGT